MSEKDELLQEVINKNMYKGALADSAASTYEINITQSLITTGTFAAPEIFYPVPGVGIPGDLKVNNASWSERIKSGNKEEYLRLMNRELLLQKYRDGIRSMAIEYMVYDIHGRAVWLHQTVHLSEDPTNGDVLGLIVIVDRTEERKTAVENEKHMRLIEGLTSEYETVCSVDLYSGKMEFYRTSKSMQEKYGKLNRDNFEETIRRFSEIGVFETDRERFLSHLSLPVLRKILKEKKGNSFTFRVTNPAGPLYYRAKLVPITNSLGEYSKILMGFANIQDERRAETRRQQVLETALEQARQASAAKNQFLSRMSHDIRTPMNAIIGFSEIAALHPGDAEKVADCLRKIRFAGRHLLRLIDDVLDISRIESGRTLLHEEVTSFRELVKGVSDLFIPTMERKHQVFSLDIDASIEDHLILDKVRMSQLLSNLLANSVKYTPDGGQISIDIRNRGAAPNGYRGILLHVIDNGIGMSKEFQAHVFEPFEREKNPEVTGQTGTGLGASICKGIVEAMGGTISVWSNEGTGTIFTVDVDLKIADQDDDEAARQTVEELIEITRTTIFDPADELENAAESREQAGESPAGSGGNPHLRLLMAEDNELNREITAELLTGQGYLVETAEDGQKALAMIMQHGNTYYDAVLMDIEMPVMNGYEAAEAIRMIEDPRVKELPIIAVTANVYDASTRRAKEAGMNACISKPIEIRVLTDLLKTVLGSRGV